MRRFLLCLFACFSLLAAMAQAKDTARVKPVRPFVLGEIHELRSKVLGETRVLNIYLPEGYNPKDTTRYPVVYLLDGSADEDFIHISGLYQYNSFPWIGQVPRSIVVGIATVDRRRDLTYPTRIVKDKQRYPTTGGSAAFMSFLEKELQPYIEKTFRTGRDRTIIGQSLGGLFAAEVLFTKPALFNHYIIVSPSLWWDNGSLLERKPELLQAGYPNETHIYVAVGKEGLVPGDNPRVMEVDANMLADMIRQGKSPQVHVAFDYLPAEDHATILHQAVANALRQLYQRKPVY